VVHIPDGFIDAPTSLAAGAVAVGVLGVSVRRSGAMLEDKEAPLAGLVAAFVFAVQMLNVPVAGGTSGHLLGGLLAAVLVGPYMGAVCMSVVLVVQALLFADGGLSALGLNVLNMAIVGAIVGYGIFLLARRVLPRTRGGVVAASAVAAFASVVLASVAFSVEYAVGGAGGASPARVAAAMVGAHVLIGIGEAVITAMTVGAVLAVRPDLVHGARGVATGAAEPGRPLAPVGTER
jgi:cobalt/nickel transport system permease protein